jgi:FkbM family methyltransferase
MHEMTKTAIQQAQNILDIGANIGQSAALYKSLNPQAEILSIEANPACESELKKRSNHYIITALGSDSSEKEFFVNKNEPTCQGASFFREQTHFYGEGNVNVSKIKTTRLDDLTGDVVYDFIKIDTQGSELPIIIGGKNTIKKAKWVLLETPVVEYNKGSASLNEITGAMNELGFVFAAVDCENKFQEQTVQKDILFKNSAFQNEADLSNNILINGKFEALRDAYLSSQPDCYLEIGCFRLNTAINLMKLHMPKEAYLFDLFEKAPPNEAPPEMPPLSIGEASELLKKNINNYDDVSLIKGNSNKTLVNVVDKVNETKFEKVMVFIDGGHSYITTIRDMINASVIKHRTIIAVDDADWPEISVAISDLLKIVKHRNPIISKPLNNLVIIDINENKTN